MKYIYYFAKKNEYTKILKNGIDINIDYISKLHIDEEEEKIIICYLNPKDSILFNDPNYAILKIEVEPIRNVIIANDLLDSDLLEESFTYIEDYIRGSFEYPVAVVYSSVKPENISIYNRLQDYPIDYNTSDDLYYISALDKILNDYNMTSKTTLWAILDFMYNEGLFEMTETEDSYIYIDKKTNKKYTISID